MPKKTDSEIEQWVLRELRSSGKVGSREICVFACGEVVTLKGSVQSYKSKLAAEEAAYRVAGVLEIINEIRVKPYTALIEKSSASASLAALRRQGVLVHPTAIEPYGCKSADGVNQVDVRVPGCKRCLNNA
jgi:hypothetical protein